MSFEDLGPDHFAIISEQCDHWPGLFQVCTHTYHWMLDFWRTQERKGNQRTLARFSQHVHNLYEYTNAIKVTPEWLRKTQEVLMSDSTIATLLCTPHNSGFEVFKWVANNVSTKKWRTRQSVLYTPFVHSLVRGACGHGHEDFFWVFIAYEAARVGNKKALFSAALQCRSCLAHINAYLLDMVFKAHNVPSPTDCSICDWFGRRGRVGARLYMRYIGADCTMYMGFHQCLLASFVHNDPQTMKYIIKSHGVNLQGSDVSRLDLTRFVTKHSKGREQCMKIMQDYEVLLQCNPPRSTSHDA